MPEGLSFVDGAATHVAFATAWELVVVHTNVNQGDFVIATAGVGEKLESAKELGARYGINYNEESIEDGVVRITDGRGADVCIEMVGGRVLQESIRALAHNGRLATCGAHAGEKVEIDMIEFFRKQLTMSGNHFSPKANNVKAFNLIADGAVKRIIANKFALQDMAEAHSYLASRNFFGKVVLEV